MMPNAGVGIMVFPSLEDALKHFKGMVPSQDVSVSNPLSENLSALKGRIVSFEYEGGSNPGGVRIVKVEHTDGAHVEGYDLQELYNNVVNDNIGNTYRKYHVDKIIGNVTVIK